MAALSADTHVPVVGSNVTKYAFKAVGADTFFRGALVFGDATNGKAQVTTPAAGDVFLGVCVKQTVAAAADDLVECYITGTFAFAMATPAEGDVGDVMVVDVTGTASDNQADAVTGADATLAANDILIGKISAISNEDTTRAIVTINPGWIYSATLGWV